MPITPQSHLGSDFTSLVSVSTGKNKGNGQSDDSFISGDGRWVTFSSAATNLVTGDTNGVADVFLHDRQTGATTRVSVSSAGVEGNAQSLDPAISADGRYVVFQSDATNLVASDTNGVPDVFRHDRQTGTTIRVSVSTAGAEANGYASDPVVSSDGRYVVFQATASNLVTGDTNGKDDVFVRDTDSSTTSRLSVVTGGGQATGGDSASPSVSDDGRYVAFHSKATNLVTGDTNATFDVFLHDRQTTTTTRMSVDSAGAQATGGDSVEASIAGDGSKVGFESDATNLVAGDTNAKRDVFVRTIATNTTVRVSVSSGGAQGNDTSSEASLSGDGSHVAFDSLATNLIASDTNGKRDIFVKDLAGGTVTRYSVSTAGVAADKLSQNPSISADEHHVAFQSDATNLVPEDTDVTKDIYVRGPDIYDPIGSIAYPEANRPLGGAVTVTGTATDGQSFQNYQLEYGAGPAPGSWTSIGTYTTQVGGTATLATWQTGTLAAGVYTLRLTVRETGGHPNSVTTRLVYVDNTRRGEESYLTKVPFDLGGGWSLGVNVATGEASLMRDLFSIPSYGPSQALSLAYSSQDGTTGGRFGYGWVSNLTQYLTFESGFVVWHRSDGGRVPFGDIGGTWTPLRGHFETLTRGASEDTITLKDQSKLVFENSGSGRLKRSENRFGKALTFVWNSGSATATDASGRVTNITINAANNRLTNVTDSAGRAWAFGYNGSNELTTVTDPASKVTTFTYDGSHRLRTISRTRTPASGPAETILWTVSYTSGKATSILDPIGDAVTGDPAHTFTYNTGNTVAGLLKTYGPIVRNNTTHTFDSLGRVTSTLDPEGWTTTRAFDADSNLTEIVYPIATGVGQTVTTTYDSRGNALTETTQLDAATTVVTLMTYNTTNDVLIRSEADNDAAVNLVTKYQYDAAGHLIKVNVNCTTSGTTPPADASTCTGVGTQDAATNLITEYRYTANDQLEFEHDPLGRVTMHVYDTWGNQTAVIKNCTTSGTTPPSPWDSCTAGGTADHQTNVAEATAYDQATTAGKAGLPTSRTDPVGNTTTFAFDNLGRLTSEVLPGDSSIPALTRSTTYDEFGNALTESDNWTGLAAPRVTTHAYDKRNRQTSVTDAAGVVTSTSYDAAGNATSSTSDGVTTTRVFDGLGRAVSESTEGETTLHAFDAQSRETSITNPELEMTTMAYDRAGRLLTEVIDTGGLELTTSYTYDRLGRELTTTAPDGTTTNSYDRVGREVTTSVGGATTTTGYDRAGNPITSVDATGTLMTSSFDPLNRLTVEVTNDVPIPSLPSEDVTTTIYYNAAGAEVAFTDARGVTSRTLVNVRGSGEMTIDNCTDAGATPTSNPRACTGAGTHDTKTNVVTTLTYDGSGSVIVRVVDFGNGDSGTTSIAFDAGGRQRATKDPMGTVSRTIYDISGRVQKVIQNCTESTTNPVPPSGNWWECDGSTLNDGTWNLTTTYGYDARSNKTSETAPNGRLTTFVYDDADRLISRIDNDVASPNGPTEDVTTSFHYDDAGRQVAVKAPLATTSANAVTRLLYNGEGRLWKEIRNCTDTGTTPPADPATCTGAGTADADTNVVTEYAYDDRGNKTVVTAPDPSASGTQTVTTRYAFDADNRLCRVLENATVDLQTLADPCSTAVSGTASQNVSTRYTYDGAGNLVSMIDGRGKTTTYGYDAAGRMTSLTDANGKTVTYGYDALGRRIRQSNRVDPPLSNSVTWTHDGAGRLLTRTAAGAATVTYTYDDNGNQLSASDGTRTITTTYDRPNRPLSVSVSNDAGAGTTYSYSLTSRSWTDPTGSYTATLDKFDRQVSLTDPIHGVTPSTWTYRSDGQPSAMAAPNNNTTAYGYDDLGRSTSAATTGTGGVSRASYTWTLNRAGQITSEASTISGDPTNGTTNYTFDPLARLTGFARAGTTTSYGWQAVPNRSSVQVGANPAVTTSYDDANRPTSDSAGGTYTSDFDGRLTARPGQTLEWDSLGRLIRVRNSGGTILATYTYDPLDRLLIADYGGTNRIRFRYVGRSTAVAQILDDVGGTVSRHIANDMNGTRLVDWTGTGQNQRFYGTNGHHDVTWTADSTGAVSATLRYDPWGTLTSSTGTSLPDFRFQSSWFDTTTSLSWAISRWYASSAGRFVSEDILPGEADQPGSRHLYAYGQGEPVGRWDPRGRHWYWTDADDTAEGLSLRFYGTRLDWPRIPLGNPAPPGEVTPHMLTFLDAGERIGARKCIWIPWTEVPHSWCNAARGDSLGKSNLWRTYNGVSTRVLERMRERAVDGADGLGTINWFWPNNIAVLIRFAQLVQEGGLWDIKHEIHADFGAGRLFRMAVRDDAAPEVFRSDLWGLIHYGYVGRAHGIHEDDLRFGNRFFGGVQAADDDLALEIGMRLWKRWGFDINLTRLRRSVLFNLLEFRRLDGDAITVPLKAWSR